MDMNITMTFTRAELDERLEQLNKQFITAGNPMDAKRTWLARNPENPHAIAEARALLLGLPSPDPSFGNAREFKL